MSSKTVSVQLSNGTLRRVEEVSQHYRWKRSQAITEYVSFYHRVVEYMSEFDVGRYEGGDEEFVLLKEKGGPFHILDSEQVEQCFIRFIREVNKGMLASFRDPIDFDAEDAS